MIAGTHYLNPAVDLVDLVLFQTIGKLLAASGHYIRDGAITVGGGVRSSGVDRSGCGDSVLVFTAPGTML